MKKIDIIYSLLKQRVQNPPTLSHAKAFAPTNIALCKYWGKRNQELNLPITSSLSISLRQKGATTQLDVIDDTQDILSLNQQEIAPTSSFYHRLVEFLNLFRKNKGPYFKITLQSNIPIAAGLASSACGFAAMTLALNELYQWKLSLQDLSILARLGSGSACRSLWQGFVEWHRGTREDGLDSFAEPIKTSWSELYIGLLILNPAEKKLSSREAMQRTITTSSSYSAWPNKVASDLALLKHAIEGQDFGLFGKIAESNALSMHSTMLSAWPPIMYFSPETIQAMHKIWQLREEGLSIYFTQDAGANLKLLFLKKDIETVGLHFPALEMIPAFPKSV